MRIETDVNRVRALAADKEDENWEFRTFLKNIDLFPEQVDAIVHRHYEEIAGQIDCCACANCCKTALPDLSSPDIARLARRLNTSDHDIVSRYLKPNEDGDAYTFTSTPCPFLSEGRCTV